jgi:thioredoxin 1
MFVQGGIVVSVAKAVTASTFEQEVIQSTIPVLVDFWAEWCGPCKALGPTLDAVAQEFDGKIRVVKLDVQSEAAVATKYGIVSIPALLCFKNGQVVDRMIGLQPKPNIVALLNRHA